MTDNFFLSLEKESFFDQIETEVSISSPLEPNKKISGKALWDTGATCTVVNENKAKDLNLKVISVTKVKMADGTERRCPNRIVDISLPSNINLLKYKVSSFNIRGEHVAIIGMDIIGCGAFCNKYLSDKKKSIFTFSVDPKICMIRDFHSKKL